MTTTILYFNQKSSPDNTLFESKGVLDGLNVTLQIGDLVRKVLMDEKYTFVHFTYTIQNNNPYRLVFDPGLIKVNYNGILNKSTEYDSLASTMTEVFELPHGVSVYSLYLVFDQHNISKDITFFAIEETGISIEG
jgi:hypothetical protein